ncbi:universal stress protein [Herbidospora galbida]|uniref:Universal stress protein n=1 Tax=Herbidospora galbida TaxID=2575442 RepID=A0A4U3MER5_9ACTN|nr:universal stress protein [Herbidospora galbida]TKK87611.1 universal stress protein [Herbidospora galbida]
MIVAGVDGSPSALAAVEYAAADAVRRGATLRLVHVREPWTGIRLSQLNEVENTYGEEVLATAERRARARAPGLGVTTALATGGVVARLKEEAAKADAVVIGSRGTGGFAGMILGSVGLGLAGHAPGPVIVVREPSSSAYGRLVAGYDGGEEADVALEYAFAEAQRRGAGLRAVFSWQPPPFSSVGTMYDNLIHCVYEERTTFVEERFAAWRDRHPGVPVEYASVYGHPVNVLAEESRAADLVIAGSRGLGAVGAAVLGSVGHGLLHHAHCPVAIVS